ncbi:Anthranilate synthase component 1 [Candidatus Annandia adelgestsuga]|uniref:Anthranilate synthase component 1 n=1 Tax=Candidatus Annandia adelgestsuga TaxID=1302411 RepID=A0A3S9J7R6_9ENTR|nr:anthranilate synthase component 1 [Candidatus Annandia adelgestsuga]AZP36411.1 Anthranilate synthase component 1 [Candidatus Annandia adelgestsuga]
MLNLIIKNIKYKKNPTLIFNKICNIKSSTLLLESSDINNKCNLKSLIIIDSAIRIISNNNYVLLISLSKNGNNLLSLLDKKIPYNIFNKKIKNGRKLFFPKLKNINDEDSRLKTTSVFDSLRILTKLIHTPKEERESMLFGGLFSYDLINCSEKLPIVKNINKCPNFCFYLSEILLILNHQKKKSRLQASIFVPCKTESIRIKKRINILNNILSKKNYKLKNFFINKKKIKCNIKDSKYCKMIIKMKKSIYEGDIFQVVISRKFFLPCILPLNSYDNLKKNNPSPYMFFMKDQDFILFGTSPESSLKYNSKNRKIEIYPIAGSRPRGYKKNGNIDYDFDSKIELEMRMDKKEIAEHLMLVDLARNDLAKICNPGSRYVSDLMKVDKYSCIMHLVSRVVGTLKKDLDIFNAYRACMNMGTLSGAPKVKAMQFINLIEKYNRGSYGGSIGYFTSNGDLDTCIIIRSAYIENNIAIIQAGAGIVIDSNPKLESEESRNKAKAVLKSIIFSNFSKEV